jgi:hypothetical protein
VANSRTVRNRTTDPLTGGSLAAGACPKIVKTAKLNSIIKMI